jgi:hypothetical protein
MFFTFYISIASFTVLSTTYVYTKELPSVLLHMQGIKILSKCFMQQQLMYCMMMEQKGRKRVGV